MDLRRTCYSQLNGPQAGQYYHEAGSINRDNNQSGNQAVNETANDDGHQEQDDDEWCHEDSSCPSYRRCREYVNVGVSRDVGPGMLQLS